MSIDYGLERGLRLAFFVGYINMYASLKGWTN